MQYRKINCEVINVLFVCSNKYNEPSKVGRQSEHHTALPFYTASLVPGREEETATYRHRHLGSGNFVILY